jgi:hypothetical protein
MFHYLILLDFTLYIHYYIFKPVFVLRASGAIHVGRNSLVASFGDGRHTVLCGRRTSGIFFHQTNDTGSAHKKTQCPLPGTAGPVPVHRGLV